jgi:glycerophosphoryl diester phosphodiesterase
VIPYKKPLVIACRGDRENAPENTLPAFESAISKGADGIELDVHFSADKKLVVHHFYNLGSTDNGQGIVSEYPLIELRALDSGSWFNEKYAGIPKPTLGEVLETCKGRIRFEIDLKDSGLDFLQAVIREIEQHDLVGDVELTSAHYPLLTHAKKLNPKIRTGSFFYEPPDWMPVRLAQKHVLDWAELLNLNVVHLNIALISPEFVEQLHRGNLFVHGSNLDTPEYMWRGLELGVDSFSTGQLDTALRVRDRFVASRP